MTDTLLRWWLSGVASVCQWLTVLAVKELAPDTVRALMGAIGIISSVVTFALGSVMARPAMVRWRGTAWRVLVLWWAAAVLSVADVVMPVTVGTVPNVAVKLGLFVWLIGLVSLLALTRRILFLQTSALWALSRRKLDAFPSLKERPSGVAVLDWWAEQLAVQHRELYCPILLIADRESPGLRLAHRLLVAGLSRDEGVVYLTFTRPARLIVKQLANLARGGISPAVFENRVIIIDGYSPLYAQGKRQKKVSAAGLTANVIECDARDPVAVQKAYTGALTRLKKAGAAGARAVYDSLTDFVAIADPDLVAAYLRRMVVFEEEKCVRALYLLWPDVLTQPMGDQYLSWFFPSVLRLRTGDGVLTATLENIVGIQAHVRLDSQLDLADRGIDFDATRIAAMASAARGLEYEAIPLDDALLIPVEEPDAVQTEFLFYLTAIDHRTTREGGRYEAEVGDRTLRSSDLMYARARLRFDLFTTGRLQHITEDEVAAVFRNDDGSTIEAPGLRAWLLRQAAETITDAYGGRVQTLLQQCQGRLESPNRTGLLQRLAVVRAYEDPLRKKSHLLVKLLERRKLFTPGDPEHEDVPADPVLVHLALVSGLITVADSELTGALARGLRLTVGQADRLRLATLRAFHQVCGDSGVSPYALDDLLWGLGRELRRPPAEFEAFLARSPIVRGVKKPDKLRHFLDVLRGQVPDPTPFAGIDRPLFPDTWYY
jgi:hypothetical protein